MCWFIPLITGLLTAWLTCRYCRSKGAYEYARRLEQLKTENERLKQDLKKAQEQVNTTPLYEVTADSNIGGESGYQSAVFHESMQRLVKIEESAKATTLEKIDMAPAESHELSKLKADFKEYVNHTDFAKKQVVTPLATGVSATALTQSDAKQSDFLRRVVGKDVLQTAVSENETVQATTDKNNATDNVSYESHVNNLAKNELEPSVSKTTSDVEEQRTLHIEAEGSTADEFSLSHHRAQNPAAAAVVLESQKQQHNKQSDRDDVKHEVSAAQTIGLLTSSTFDKKAARAAIGKAVKFDDLTVVEGIGPKISGLFKAEGISTWHKLSETSVSACQKILDDAGPRYRVHTPETWPEQAMLAAKGEWEALAKLQDSLDGGRKS